MKTDNSLFSIRPATTRKELAAARQLFITYHKFLGEDLRFQSFEAELASLPGHMQPQQAPCY